jgi:hypothetical protein
MKSDDKSVHEIIVEELTIALQRKLRQMAKDAVKEHIVFLLNERSDNA